MNPADQGNQVTDVGEKEQKDAASYTRMAATAILVIAVPMLLLSGSALALFYIAPTRFEDILTRLPGEAAIRTVLIFAPVTLLAIIVLAVLYAFEKPAMEVTRPQVVRTREPVGEPLALTLQRIGWLIHLGAFGGLLLLVPIRAAAFLSPTRFDNFLTRFPADRWLDFLVHTGPFLLLILEMIAVGLFIGARIKPSGREAEIKLPGMRWLKNVGSTRLAVGVVLVFSLPILILSLTSLVLFFTRTERFLDLLSGLPGEVPLRMGLIFIPTSLIIVVTLALLFLARRWTDASPSLESILGGRMSWDLVLWYLSWVFVWGIALASATIMGLVVGLIVLILR
jgi:hypothetical protein